MPLLIQVNSVRSNADKKAKRGNIYVENRRIKGLTVLQVLAEQLSGHGECCNFKPCEYTNASRPQGITVLSVQPKLASMPKPLRESITLLKVKWWWIKTASSWAAFLLNQLIQLFTAFYHSFFHSLSLIAGDLDKSLAGRAETYWSGRLQKRMEIH